MDGSPRRSCGGGWGGQGGGSLSLRDSQDQARGPSAAALPAVVGNLFKRLVGLATKQPCCEVSRKPIADAAAVVNRIMTIIYLCRSQSASIGGGAAPVRTTGKDQWGEVRNPRKAAKHTDSGTT